MASVFPTSDAALLAALHAAAFPRPWKEEEFARLLAQPGVWALAAGSEGFILLRRAADEAEILTLAVAPDARRRGRGRALVEATQGEYALFLEVAEGNAAAIGLYRACGFREISRRKAYYANGENALVMRREGN